MLARVLIYLNVAEAQIIHVLQTKEAKETWD